MIIIDDNLNQAFGRSRHFADFHLAGFAYYDGLDVIDALRMGCPVDLVGEPDNPHDPDAVAVFYQGTKLGYVPQQYNGTLSTLLYFGHGDIFEAKIQMVNTENHPDRQFRVQVRVRDNR